MKKQILLVLFAVLAADVTYSQVKLERVEISKWTAPSGRISPTHDRVSSYVYLVNGEEFVNLFKGSGYTKEQRKMYNLKKNDRPTYLNLSFQYILEDRDGKPTEVMLPVYLSQISGTTSFPKLIHTGVINKVRIEDLPDNHAGDLVAKVLSHNKNTEFWKGAYNISKDLITSAAFTATGNIPATINTLKAGFSNSLTKNLSQQIDHGISTFKKSMDDIQSNKELTHRFLIKFYTPSGDRERVKVATLYQIRWQDSPIFNERDILSDLKTDTSVVIEDVENVVTRQSIPMILVIETLSLPELDANNPEFTEEYKNLIRNEFTKVDSAKIQQYVDYNNDYINALDSYEDLSSISGPEDSRFWNKLLEATDSYYQFKDGYQKAVKTKEQDDDLKKRYSILEKNLLDKFNDVKGPAPVNIKPMLRALINENSLGDINQLKGELIALNEYNSIALKNSNQNSFRKLASYQHYQEQKRKRENEMVGILFKNNPGQAQTVDYFEAIKKEHSDCGKCVDEADRRIESLNNSMKTAAAVLASYAQRQSTIWAEFDSLRGVFVDLSRLATDTSFKAHNRQESEETVTKNLTTLYEKTKPIEKSMFENAEQYQNALKKWISEVDETIGSIKYHLARINSIAIKPGTIVVADVDINSQEIISPPVNNNQEEQ